MTREVKLRARQVIMESAFGGWPSNYASPLAAKFPPYSPTGVYYRERKRTRSPGEEKLNGNVARDLTQIEEKSLDSGKYGSVTKEIKDLIDRRRQTLNTYFGLDPTLMDVEVNLARGASKENLPATPSAQKDVIDLVDDDVANDVPVERLPIVVIDSDDEETGDQKSLYPYREIVLPKPAGEFLMKDFLDRDSAQNRSVKKSNARLASEDESTKDKGVHVQVEDAMEGEDERTKDKGVYVGVEDDMETQEGNDYDGLDDIWKEMTVALECSKDTADGPPPDEHVKEEQDECDHTFVLKDDLGYVCRICGVVQRGIETIIEYQYAKLGGWGNDFQ
ncbi:Protein CHROMATIN REMODELING 35 [Camellia lanceoleosa]|uniref:Protein CHROMATIN REMODELING 35 n=1 Tax=Camellia lanceoleosa TaxID=1840588 RepID=A0ACC0IRW1_9ERIC|nr:Protein CHROMATIN REMODELING 35 [Camellia lanceoleosa]